MARIHSIAGLGFLSAIFVLHHAARAEPPIETAATSAEQQPQQVVVLQDGGVLIGKVAPDGDYYVLTRGGGEMRIQAANVLFVANSLDEAYVRRRQRLVPPKVDAHLALAEWCLRHNLAEQAKRELADARSIDSLHPRLALLERRLALAKERPRQAPAEQHTAKPPEPASKPTNEIPSSAGDLPEITVERFTRKVQPVLVNSCTTTGCHQPGGPEKFQLDRAILLGMSNRRSTMSNLAATLELVDREHPQLSPLLTVPRRTHGGMERPVFGPRQEQAFRHLVEWVALVTQEQLPPDDASAADADLAATSAQQEEKVVQLTSPVLRMPLQGAKSSPRDESVKEDSRGEIVPAEFTEQGVDSQPVPRTLRVGAQLRKWEPRDPFDPEIFNRRVQARNAANAVKR